MWGATRGRRVGTAGRGWDDRGQVRKRLMYDGGGGEDVGKEWGVKIEECDRGR